MATIPLLSTSSTLSSIGDPDGTRTMASIIVLLIALGLALILLAVWIFKATRPDPELLAPLEVMGERSWRRKDPVWQRRRLDELRPPGAKPLVPSAAPPELDEAFEAGPSASGFDDLRVAEPPQVATARPDAAAAGGAHAVEDVEDVEVGTTSGSGDGPGDATPDETPAPELPDRTPSALIGPSLDELPDDDFDPEALAAARSELERELAETSRRGEQLGRSEGDEHA